MDIGLVQNRLNKPMGETGKSGAHCGGALSSSSQDNGGSGPFYHEPLDHNQALGDLVERVARVEQVERAARR